MIKLSNPIFLLLLLIPNYQLSLFGSTVGNEMKKLNDNSKVDSLRITILYDNYKSKINSINDWGFSCLIEGTEKTILFDSGAKGDILLANADKLNIDLKKVDLFFLSHNHSDHTGGINSLLSINGKVPAYISISTPNDFLKDDEFKNISRVDKPIEICKGVFSTGEMGNQIKEQSLIIKTVKGLVIVTGCSHQGIIEIIQKAKEIFNENVYLVLGGFHLLQYSDDSMKEILIKFKELGVVNCGATHCTGEKQIQMFKETFKQNYCEMGTGRVVFIYKNGIELK
jgi:7,8-dihydropterin-6-yl-methyl-4-(beta-D-ribofuranosyl)aminobenzene 5'-phosphate synthase